MPDPLDLGAVQAFVEAQRRLNVLGQYLCDACGGGGGADGEREPQRWPAHGDGCEIGMIAALLAEVRALREAGNADAGVWVVRGGSVSGGTFKVETASSGLGRRRGRGGDEMSKLTCASITITPAENGYVIALSTFDSVSYHVFQRWDDAVVFVHGVEVKTMLRPSFNDGGQPTTGGIYPTPGFPR